MPYVASRGNQIHYSVEGTGPLVVLLHGLLSDARSWNRWGVVDALADGYCVACVDSLGHGLSDKPDDERFYALEGRSRDVVAVMDDLGFARGHLLGYSMGGWLAVGVAKRHRERLSSLVVGGWDVLHGVQAAGAVAFPDQLAAMRTAAPAAMKWVTADLEPALCACWDALADVEGAREAVVNAGVPVLLWSGRDDLNHEPMRTFAAMERLGFLSTEGDHRGAIWRHGAQSGREIRTFLDACPN